MIFLYWNYKDFSFFTVQLLRLISGRWVELHMHIASLWWVSILEGSPRVCLFHNLIVAINLEFCSCISLVNFHFYSCLNVQAQHLVGICATACVFWHWIFKYEILWSEKSSQNHRIFINGNIRTICILRAISCLAMPYKHKC